jgi:hypothetical protein
MPSFNKELQEATHISLSQRIHFEALLAEPFPLIPGAEITGVEKPIQFDNVAVFIGAHLLGAAHYGDQQRCIAKAHYDLYQNTEEAAAHLRDRPELQPPGKGTFKALILAVDQRKQKSDMVLKDPDSGSAYAAAFAAIRVGPTPGIVQAVRCQVWVNRRRSVTGLSVAKELRPLPADRLVRVFPVVAESPEGSNN